MILSSEFNACFSKFGFEEMLQDQESFTAFCQGKEVGVYLKTESNTFSVETVFNFMTQKLFYWQNFDSLNEIEQLIIKNHILSEQICEKSELAIYT